MAGGRRSSGVQSAALILLCVVAGSAAAKAEEQSDRKPDRIVSLNLCSDQILLDLVPKERIAALSELVVDPALSGRVASARGVKLVRGHAEEVLVLAPDLVLAGEYSTPATVSLLRRLGINVVTVPLATDFAGIRAAIRAIAKAVGEDRAGRAIVDDFDRRIEAAARLSPSGAAKKSPTAIVYHVNSLASGAGSLLDEIVRAAGYHNAARDMRLGPGDRLPLETLVLQAPDAVVMATAPEAFRTTAADNLRHPAFRAILAQRQSVHLPMPLWMCGTADVAGAVEQLAAARLGIERREAER